jgi:hypothetical protein
MKTNYLALVACGVANALLGMGWYGIFADKWMAGHGITEEMVENMANPGMTYGLSFAVAVISAWILNWLFQRMNVNDWMDGAKTGAAIGLFGLLGTIVANMYALKSFELSFVDGGFVLLQFAVFGAIIGGWQKR